MFLVEKRVELVQVVGSTVGLEKKLVVRSRLGLVSHLSHKTVGRLVVEQVVGNTIGHLQVCQLTFPVAVVELPELARKSAAGQNWVVPLKLPVPHSG